MEKDTDQGRNNNLDSQNEHQNFQLNEYFFVKQPFQNGYCPAQIIGTAEDNYYLVRFLVSEACKPLRKYEKDFLSIKDLSKDTKMHLIKYGSEFNVNFYKYTNRSIYVTMPDGRSKK